MLSEWAGSAQTSVWHYRRGHALGIVVTFHISMRHSRPGMIETYRPYIRSKIHGWVAECQRVAAWLLDENDVPQLDAPSEEGHDNTPENSEGEAVVPTDIHFGTHVFASNMTE
jgi:hypothetical protein